MSIQGSVHGSHQVHVIPSDGRYENVIQSEGNRAPRITPSLKSPPPPEKSSLHEKKRYLALRKKSHANFLRISYHRKLYNHVLSNLLLMQWPWFLSHETMNPALGKKMKLFRNWPGSSISLLRILASYLQSATSEHSGLQLRTHDTFIMKTTANETLVHFSYCNLITWLDRPHKVYIAQKLHESLICCRFRGEGIMCS